MTIDDRDLEARDADEDELDRIWAALARLPEGEPSPLLRARFDRWFAQQRQGEGVKGPNATRRAAWIHRSWPVAAALLVGLGLGALRPGSEGANEPRDAAPAASVEALRDEVRVLNRLVALTLLDRPGASEQLVGVHRGRDSASSDEQVIAALLAVVASDAHLNVRLAAIDALAPSVGRADVRTGLLASLGASGGAPAPLLQVSVAAALIDSGDAASRRGVASWLDRAGETVDPSVREFVARRLEAET